MKTKSIILAGLFMILGYAAQSQELRESVVRILPTTEKGILKVLFANNTGQSVKVKFFSEDGEILSDRIKASAFHNGFSKKYDVRNIGLKKFFVEVSSAQLSVTYKMTESKDGLSFIPALEKSSGADRLVASSN